MTGKTCLVVVLLISIVQIAGAQATLQVPATYPTIQAGIDNAVTGDTVLVAPGTYFENLIIQDKEIRLIGSGGPNVTIVDGNNAGTVLCIKPNLGRALWIEGFTFTHGRGVDGFGYGHEGKPGGIYVQCSSPTIKNCRIVNNRGGDVGDRAQGGAGGIALMGCGPDIDGAAILNCVIRANIGGTTIPHLGVMNGQGGTGGVLLTEANMFMRATYVRDNCGGDSYFSTMTVGAGGVELSLPRRQTKFEDSVICDNVAGMAGEGTPLAGAGGIHGGSPEILFCVVDNNIGGPVGGEFGVNSSGAGGIYGLAPKIRNTYIRNNKAGYSGMEGLRGAGGGVYVAGNALIESSVITDNEGGSDGLAPGMGGGGGIHALSGDVTVIQCTVANNVGGSAYDLCGCGGIHSDFGSLAIVNSILWGDSGGVGPTPGAPEAGGPGLITAVFSNVDGGWIGFGNMNVDPLFVAEATGDYHLMPTSPVRDMGDGLVPDLPLKDIDGEPRPIGNSTDMGADEFNRDVYPGTGEDLVLETVVNYWGDPRGSVKYFGIGDVLDVRIFSPMASFSPGDFWLLGSPFLTGSPPMPIPGFPGFQLDPFGIMVLAPGPLPVLDGGWPNGRRWIFNGTVSVPGWSLMVQGFALDGSALNGWYAATQGHELRFD
ncbi:MAG: hypothetical protein H6807_04145 [Planctomycetes bacterium]|nr:hypothetical protein [Planctomycetota bacterium]